MLKFPIRVSAIAFDLDGTLVDTLPDLHEAGCRMLRELGCSPVDSAATRSFVGDGIDQLVGRLLRASAGERDAAFGDAARVRFRQHYAEGIWRESRIYPGVIEGLQALRSLGLSLACVTNKATEFTQPLLRDSGLDSYFELVVSGDTLPRKKPDPLPLAHCARVFDIPVTELLMVGDSPNDTVSARAAGAPVFCVPWGYCEQVRDLDCDAIVDSLVSISSLIALSQS
jgi:phosphoglycolate phosphatase